MRQNTDRDRMVKPTDERIDRTAAVLWFTALSLRNDNSCRKQNETTKKMAIFIIMFITAVLVKASRQSVLSLPFVSSF